MADTALTVQAAGTAPVADSRQGQKGSKRAGLRSAENANSFNDRSNKKTPPSSGVSSFKETQMARGKYKARAENKRIEELEAEVEDLSRKIKDVSAQLKDEKEAHESMRRETDTKVRKALGTRVFDRPAVIGGVSIETSDFPKIMRGLKPSISHLVLWALKVSGSTSDNSAAVLNIFSTEFDRYIARASSASASQGIRKPGQEAKPLMLRNRAASDE